MYGQGTVFICLPVQSLLLVFVLWVEEGLLTHFWATLQVDPVFPHCVISNWSPIKFQGYYFEITHWGVTGSTWSVAHNMCWQAFHQSQSNHQQKAWYRLPPSQLCTRNELNEFETKMMSVSSDILCGWSPKLKHNTTTTAIIIIFYGLPEMYEWVPQPDGTDV